MGEATFASRDAAQPDRLMPDSTQAQPASTLPDEIVQAIAIANAKCIGEMPAVLANLALANQIFNNNLQQQMQLQLQQAVNHVLLAIVARCVNTATTGELPPDTIKAVNELKAVIASLSTPSPPSPPSGPSSGAASQSA